MTDLELKLRKIEEELSFLREKQDQMDLAMTIICDNHEQVVTWIGSVEMRGDRIIH